ncbi:PH domain-like [Phytophthora cactorum]|nr:PH domain-like [Phytophthora cactorum]
MASTIASFANFLKQSKTHAVDNREVLIAGVLYKKPERNSLLWKKRYCIVYFLSLEDFEKRAIRGKIPFSSVHPWDGKPNGFQFYTPADNCFRVYTDSSEDQQKWIDVMQQCIDNAPDKKDGEKVEYTRPGASFRSKRSDSWREEDPDVLSMAVELEDLRSEVTTLKAELASYEQAEKRYGTEISAARTRRGSVLDDGTELSIEPREMERMRAIFNLFDVQGNGFITISYMHSKSATGQIDFNSFMKWWNDDHAADNQTEAMRRYQAKFKFLKARIANPEVGNRDGGGGRLPELRIPRQLLPHGPNGERQQISPWHDIPLYNPDGTVNFICEIPKWTRKKMEIATGEPFNPIKQDTKNGKLREYGWGEMMFNYGAMPQTWEDPSHVTEGTGCQWRTGSIVQVKILGVLALIDDNETDWKVICINVEDHYAPLINDVADVEAHMPGCITAIHDWLRDYKLPQVNKYGYDDKCMGRDFAEATVAETHEFWKLLIEQRGGQATV